MVKPVFLPNSPDSVVPTANEAEEAVIGSILLDPFAASRVAWLKPSMFHSEEMRTTYSAICNLRERRAAADFLTVRHEIETGDYQPEVSPARLASLLNVVPTSTHVEHYAGLVRTAWQRRALIDAGSLIARIGYEAEDMTKAMIQAQDAVRRIDAGDALTGAVDMGQAIDDAVEAQAQATRRGLSTGLADLDRLLGGWKPGKLYTVAGATGVGKTITACNFALAAVRAGARVAWWSGEMGHEELVMRLAANVANVDSWLVEQDQMGDDQRERYFDALNWLTENARIDFLRRGCPTVQTLADAVARKHQSTPYGLVIVDYMQRMVAAADNLPALVGQVSTVLKDLSLDLDVPVIGYSQLSREINKRQDRRPQLSDLYYSGRVEQDSDVVVALYREGYELDTPPVQGEMEMLVRKHRGGRLGVARVYYNMPTLKLGDLAREAA